ncbi:MAG: HAD-IIB family hydrolase [Bacilli bacterium]
MFFTFDLDGTIIYKGQPLSDTLERILLEVKDAGHTLIFCSARSIRDMYAVLPTSLHDEILIGGNGTVLTKEKQIIQQYCWPEHVRTDIQTLLEQQGVDFYIEESYRFATSSKKPHPLVDSIRKATPDAEVDVEAIDHILKMIVVDTEQLVQHTEQFTKHNLYIQTYSDFPGIWDIRLAHCTKRSALEYLAIPNDQCVCFGNDYNDIPMFQWSERSYCVGNHEELMKVATHVLSGENAESQIVEVLKQYVLHQEKLDLAKSYT